MRFLLSGDLDLLCGLCIPGDRGRLGERECLLSLLDMQLTLLLALYPAVLYSVAVNRFQVDFLNLPLRMFKEACATI